VGRSFQSLADQVNTHVCSVQIVVFVGTILSITWLSCTTDDHASITEAASCADDAVIDAVDTREIVEGCVEGYGFAVTELFSPDLSITEHIALGHQGALEPPGLAAGRYEWAAGAANALIWSADTLTGESLKNAFLAMRCILTRRLARQQAPVDVYELFKATQAVLQEARKITPDVPYPGISIASGASLGGPYRIYRSIGIAGVDERFQANGWSLDYHAQSELRKNSETDFAYQRHWDFPPVVYPLIWETMADVLLEIRNLSQAYTTTQSEAPQVQDDLLRQADNAIATFAFLAVLLRPTPLNNWSIFYVIISQARKLFNKAPRYSLALDILLHLGADTYEQALKLYPFWDSGVLDPFIFQQGANILRYSKTKDPLLAEAKAPWSLTPHPRTYENTVTLDKYYHLK